jgi:hypothetical protein
VGHHKDFWSIEPKGLNLHQLSQAPEWYTATKDSPLFTNLEQENEPGPNPDAPSDEQHTISFRSPDGLVEIVLRQTGSEDDQVDGPGHGKHYELHDLQTGKAIDFEQLPGFEGVFEILHDSLNKSRHFLIEPPLRLAFFGLHLNSTDGDTCYALDLINRRLVRLSQNWAAPIPLPGEAAFLTWTTERYVAIPKSKKTANCSETEGFPQSVFQYFSLCIECLLNRRTNRNASHSERTVRSLYSTLQAQAKPDSRRECCCRAW